MIPINTKLGLSKNVISGISRIIFYELPKKIVIINVNNIILGFLSQRNLKEQTNKIKITIVE